MGLFFLNFTCFIVAVFFELKSNRKVVSVDDMLGMAWLYMVAAIRVIVVIIMPTL